MRRIFDDKGDFKIYQKNSKLIEIFIQKSSEIIENRSIDPYTDDGLLIVKYKWS